MPCCWLLGSSCWVLVRCNRFGLQKRNPVTCTLPADTTSYQTVGMNAPVRKLRLPPLESVWSWPRYVSPHLADIEKECLEWSASFGAFDPETQRLIHDYGKLSMFLLMVLEIQRERRPGY